MIGLIKLLLYVSLDPLFVSFYSFVAFCHHSSRHPSALVDHAPTVAHIETIQ